MHRLGAKSSPISVLPWTHFHKVLTEINKYLIKENVSVWKQPFLSVLSVLAWGMYPDSKVQGANMGAIWGRQDPGGPHVGPMNFAIWVVKSLAKYYIFIMLLEWHHMRVSKHRQFDILFSNLFKLTAKKHQWSLVASPHKWLLIQKPSPCSDINILAITQISSRHDRNQSVMCHSSWSTSVHTNKK